MDQRHRCDGLQRSLRITIIRQYNPSQASKRDMDIVCYLARTGSPCNVLLRKETGLHGDDMKSITEMATRSDDNVELGHRSQHPSSTGFFVSSHRKITDHNVWLRKT